MGDLPSGVLAVQALRQAGDDLLFTLAGGRRRPGGDRQPAGDRPHGVHGPVTKRATTASRPEEAAVAVLDAYRLAGTPHRGPAFVDIPIDVIYAQAGEDTVPAWREPDPIPVDADGVAATVLAEAERPVVVGVTGVWYGGAWAALQALAETLRAPVVLNGQGRGCVPADHELAIARARGCRVGWRRRRRRGRHAARLPVRLRRLRAAEGAGVPPRPGRSTSPTIPTSLPGTSTSRLASPGIWTRRCACSPRPRAPDRRPRRRPRRLGRPAP